MPIAGNSNLRWQHDMFEGARGRGVAKSPSRGAGGAVSGNRQTIQRPLQTRRAAASSAVASPVVSSPILRRSIPSSGLTTGTKVTVANLPTGVVVEDLQELFGGDGIKLKSVRIVSDGVSEVVFTRREDAVAAVSKYDNVLLDGRAMILKLEGNAPSTKVSPVAARARNAGQMSQSPAGPSRLLRNAMQL